MCFVSKVLKGVEARYQNIKKLTQVVIVTTKKLWSYVHRHKVFMKTNCPIRQVLEKIRFCGKGEVLSGRTLGVEYPIHPEMKSHSPTDFMVEFSSHIDEDTPLK